VKVRLAISALALSASAFVGLVLSEGWCGTACIPIPGDVPTFGFGTTEGVKLGDTITPPKAVERAHKDIQKFEGAVKQCVRVPLTQGEYDAFLSLAYNIGTSAFCNSTLVRVLNAGDYVEACKQILRWDRAQGRQVRGLTLRRQAEFKTCKGE
jgi:lysozyme